MGSMRKLLLAAAAALAVVAFPATAGAAPPDVTAGTGIHELEFPFGDVYQKVHVNAQSNDGVNPRGRFLLDQDVSFDPTFTYRRHGDVTCHTVNGNRSVVAGRLDEPIVLPFGTFHGLVIYVGDNGEPGAGQDTVAIDVTPNPLPPGACPDTGLSDVIEKGNLTVHDR